MNLRRRHRPAPHIPFISLADIAWQIIIFFLVASTFLKTDSLNVALPGAALAPPEHPVKRNVTVEAGELTLAVNGVQVPAADLEPHLAAMLSGATDDAGRAVVLVADDDLSFQRNADVLYAIQRAGGVVVISEERRRDAGGAAAGGASAGGDAGGERGEGGRP